jgi:Planctomycete cytochrome C
MLFAPPPPVSYVREVAPILAMRCNGCHGEAGGLSTRTYGQLMAGGNLGKVVIPGNPDASLLVHYIEGRRGESRRMPLGGKPLTLQQIETIRRWIAENAREDSAELPKYSRKLANIRLPQRISFRVGADAYLTLTVRDRRTRRILFERAGAVKSEMDDGDIGRPGQPVIWEIRPGQRWPKKVDIELQAEYAAGDPGDLDLRINR